ncbi:c-type cytochrome biogenesis protein CcmI [Microvirga terricola]|uniref:C-type cytochrome biogenesis protein CcmI n=1 Tax=Microvirga terricola TaxID=2719797 RepID=A0ABX0VB67_9HYPH|nr:c-type cytochrome biogenesis protein CcmI [Microvirga terricola]NIX76912.1 c-type cytochrome biogenesis protein CcmI [Microvirga terricola]
MVIWIILLTMTAAAVMAVLWPLSRHHGQNRQVDPNTQFYRSQLAEIERDQEKGALLPSEAEAAKAEAARRLLRANGQQDAGFVAVGEPALRRRRAASALALSVVPILAIAIYGAYGSPHFQGGAPIAIKQEAAKLDFAAAVGQIEAHLASNPEDGRGWEVLAPVYLRMGRVDDAVKAYGSAIRYLGPEAGRLANYGEAMVLAKDGVVSAEAQAAFEQAVALDKSSAKARFYLARAAEQDGQIEKAKSAYSDLLSTSPADAPWVPVVREQLSRLGAPQSDAAEAGAPRIGSDDIARMVSGLAARLEAQGGSAEEWARLMRSYAVLGQRDKAAAAAKQARQALAKDEAGLKTIEMMARELKLTDAEP